MDKNDFMFDQELKELEEMLGDFDSNKQETAPDTHGAEPAEAGRTPRENSQRAQQEAPQRNPQRAPQEAPQRNPQRAPQEAPRRNPQRAPQENHQRNPQRTPQRTQQRPSQGISQRTAVPETQSAPIGYRRPARRTKKRRLMGFMSFLLSILAILLLAAAFVNLLVAYKGGALTAQDVRFAKISVVASAVLATLGLIFGVVTLFLRRQKKGFAITGMIFSFLMMVICCAAIYLYQYTFNTMNYEELPSEELHIVETGDDGEIKRRPEQPTVSVEKNEIEEIVEKKKKEMGSELEWEFLTDEDIPQAALDKLNTGTAQGKSYLLSGSENISNYVLLGCDRIDSTDAIMVCSVDRVHHKLKFISIPRDSYVRIPQWGTFAKLAYANNWGGIPWTVGTINYNFNLNISEYISVNFEELEQIIDLLGGVDVELSYEEIMRIEDSENLHAGKCHLNGAQTVDYARIRHSSAEDNEIIRTGRQRKVIMSALDSLSQMDITEYPGFIRECLGIAKTSFSSDELMELSAEALQNGYTVEQYALIDRMDYWGGKLGDEQYFYVVYDLNRASDQLYRIIYEDLYISGYED